MKIIRLSLTNFKGINNFTLTLDGKSARIFGQNAAGKSSLYDAFQWLLFDKDSSGASSFGIKTRDEHGVEIPMIDHSVEALLKLGDGREVLLKKTLREKWVKKRGRIDQEFEGNETIYEINGVPKKAGEYKEFVDSIAPESWFRLVTSPTYFNETLTWQKRRDLLISLLGDVKDGDVILAELDRLESLGAMLKDVSVDELRKVQGSLRQKINKELTDIPGRVDEAMKAVPEASGSAEQLAAMAQKAAQEIATLNSEKMAMENGGSVQKLRQMIAEIDTAIAKARTAHANSIPNVSEERKLVEILRSEASMLNGYSIEALANKEFDLVERSKTLGAEWTRIKASVFIRDGICPTCKQDYPENMLAVMESDFNSKKSIDLERIQKEGQQVASELSSVREKMAAAQEANKAQEVRRQAIASEIAKINAAIESKLNIPTFESLPEYAALVEQKTAIEVELKAAIEAGSVNTSSIAKKIEEKQAALNDINKQITLIDTANQQRARVAELKEKQKELAGQYEQCERVLFMIDLFEQTRAKMLDEAISGKFDLVRFKLTDQLINGGTVPTCVCTVGGVPYPDLNTAAKIQAGIDIIKTISRENGLLAPVFIDGAESICEIPDMDCQVIELIVSREHEELTVELVQ